VIQEFAYWFERISLAKLLVQYPIIFVPALILFFAGVATYIVSGDQTRNVLAKIARILLFSYIVYNILIALGIVAYLVYQHHV
jgi:predicted membrane protein